MYLWAYTDTPNHTIRHVCDTETCRFCSVSLQRLPAIDIPIIKLHTISQVTVGTCQLCGWWNIQQTVEEKIDKYTSQIYERGSYGILKKLELNDISIPLNIVRDYLVVNYESRFDVNPIYLEHIVGSVFSDHGYAVEVTASSGDGGIDIIMMNDGINQVGVQVKRYKNAVKIKEIREFAGALLIEGLPRGIFVTTSVFQPGAKKAAKSSGDRGWPIELYDAERFYAALKIAQKTVDRSSREWLSEIIPHMRTLNSYSRIDEELFEDE
jgi:restriction system protein